MKAWRRISTRRSIRFHCRHRWPRSRIGTRCWGGGAGGATNSSDTYHTVEMNRNQPQILIITNCGLLSLSLCLKVLSLPTPHVVLGPRTVRRQAERALSARVQSFRTSTVLCCARHTVIAARFCLDSQFHCTTPSRCKLQNVGNARLPMHVDAGRATEAKLLHP